jgi:hypothetical protein
MYEILGDRIHFGAIFVMRVLTLLTKFVEESRYLKRFHIPYLLVWPHYLHFCKYLFQYSFFVLLGKIID